MSVWRQFAWLTAIVMVAAAGTYRIKGPPERQFRCDARTLKPGEICLDSIPMDAQVVWVDARSRSDWEQNGVPGSVLWNLDSNENMADFEATLAMRVVETPRVVVYCGDENCGVSVQVAARIEALDLGAQVSVLRGGWRALHEAGRSRQPLR